MVMGLYGFSDLPSAQVARQLVNERKLLPQRGISVSQDQFPERSGSSSFLARAYTQLPARAADDVASDLTAVNKCSIDDTGNIIEGDEVQVRSWVNASSAVPGDDPKGYIYVWIEEDENGVLWWTGEDCPTVDPPTLLEESGSDTIVGDVWTPLTGVSFNLTQTGTYNFIYDATFNVTVIPNTTYGIGIRLNAGGSPGNGKFIYRERSSAGLEIFSGSFFFEVASIPAPPLIVTVEAIDQTANIDPLDYLAAQSVFQFYGPL